MSLFKRTNTPVCYEIDIKMMNCYVMIWCFQIFNALAPTLVKQKYIKHWK